MILTKYDSVEQHAQPQIFEIDDFDQLRDLIVRTSAPPRPQKDKLKNNLPTIVPGVLNGPRSKEAVLEITAVPFDYDKGQRSFQDAVNTLDDLGLRYIAYTTPTNTPSQPKWRVLCPLAEPLKRSDFADGPEGLMAFDSQFKKMVARLNGIFNGESDDCVFVLSQAYFFGNLEGRPTSEVISREKGWHIDELPQLDKTAIFKRGQTQQNEYATSSKTTLNFLNEQPLTNIALLLKDHPNNDAVDWSLWSEIGMSIFNACDGSPGGQEIFREWSEQCSRHSDKHLEERWRHWRKSGADYLGFDQIERKLTEAAAMAPAQVVDGVEQPKTDAKKIQVLSFADEGKEPPHDFVEQTLSEGGMSIVYGESGIGKTFWCLDLARRVAAGEDFMGFECDATGVLYISAEGGGGIWKRRDAMRLSGMDCDVPLHVIPEALDLFDPKGDTDGLIDAIKEINENSDLPIGLIFFDTLAKVSPGSDENQVRDTGMVFNNLERIRNAFDHPIHRCIVHHKGKNGDGMRGSSNLFGGVDTVIELKKVDDGMGVANVTKQKDGNPWQNKGYRLVDVELGINRRGKAFTSCVIEQMDWDDKNPAEKLTPYEATLKNIVDNLMANPRREPRRELWQKSGGGITVRDCLDRDELFPRFRDETDSDEASQEKIRKAYDRAAKGLYKKGFYVFHQNKLGVPDDRNYANGQF